MRRNRTFLCCLSAVILLSCGQRNQHPQSAAIQELITIARQFDLDNNHQDALVILDSLAKAGVVFGFYDRLVYCRSMKNAGDLRTADTMYRRFIAADTIRGERWKIIVEYLPVLYVSKNYKELRRYSDLLRDSAGDSTNKFQDIRLTYYFLSSLGENNCLEMRQYLDSLKSLVYNTDSSPLVSSEDINAYQDTMAELCPR